MLGNFDLECPMCYSLKSIQLILPVGVVKCVECGELFTDIDIQIEEGKAVEVKLEPLRIGVSDYAL